MFSLFGKNKTSQGPLDYKSPAGQARLKGLLHGAKFLYRDTNLSQEVQRLYAVGTFFRERTMCDATHKFGGVAGNTRFLIVCAAPRNMAAMSAHPEWGLCVVGANELFKVIDVQRQGELAQITVLHVPGDVEMYFRSEEANRFEPLLLSSTGADFEEACKAAPLPEFTTPEWRKRVDHPLGTDLDGKLCA